VIYSKSKSVKEVIDFKTRISYDNLWFVLSCVSAALNVMRIELRFRSSNENEK